MLLFTKEVHLTVLIYEQAVWTSFRTAHLVQGDLNSNQKYQPLPQHSNNILTND